MDKPQPPESRGRAVQARIYRDGVYGQRPPVPVPAAELEVAAIRRMSPRARAYVIGSAGMETTTAANLTGFDRWRIVPRMLRDVAVRDLGIELFGRRYATPFLTAPIGALGLVHRQADVAVARAAAELELPMIFSSQASEPMERCAAAMGDAPRWFQLYWSRSDELTASFVRRAEAIGCGAIVVTLDTHTLGWRPRDLDGAYLPFAHGLGIAQYTSDPVFTELAKRRELRPPDRRPTPSAMAALLSMVRAYPGRFTDNLRSPLPRAAVETFLEVFSRSDLTWEKLGFLREHTTLPILLKGVLHPDDAAKAVSAGVDGLVVSNHGGRQVDGAIAAIDALPDVVAAVNGRLPVLFDSGIRCGADAFKALALGAAAVCVGRPYVYGLALAGQRGVEAVLSHLIAELDLTMGLAGCGSLADVRAETVRRID